MIIMFVVILAYLLWEDHAETECRNKYGRDYLCGTSEGRKKLQRAFWEVIWTS